MEGLMFDKLRNKKRELPPLFTESELDEISPAVNYNTVMEWLIGLGDDDYAKVNQIAAVQRAADKETCKILGMECEPSTFIHPPADPEDNMSMANQYSDNEHNPTAQTLLDGDDDISSAFLDDDDQPPKKKTSKPVKVSDGK